MLNQRINALKTNIVIEKYTYLGDTPPEMRKDFEAWQESDLRREQIAAAIGEQLPLTETQRQQCNDVIAATQQYYADRHGVDVGSRLPSVENIHILARPQFEELRHKMGNDHEGLDVAGFQIAEKDIVICETDDPVLIPYITQHEIEHIIGHRTIRMIPTESGLYPRELRRGFEGSTKRNNSKAIEEYKAEATTRDIITKYWQNFASLRDFDPQFMGHEEAMDLGGTVAATANINPDDMLHNLQEAHLTGSMAPLKDTMHAVEQTWGPETNRELVKVTSAKAGELAVKLAQQNKQ